MQEVATNRKHTINMWKLWPKFHFNIIMEIAMRALFENEQNIVLKSDIYCHHDKCLLSYDIIKFWFSNES